MQKIYSQGSKKRNNLQPKQESINFILNFSKAMHVIKTRDMLIEAHKN